MALTKVSPRAHTKVATVKATTAEAEANTTATEMEAKGTNKEAEVKAQGADVQSIETDAQETVILAHYT